MGASTIKWTTLDPCTCLSESVSKLYTNFNFCEDKDCEHLEIYVGLQSQEIYVETKTLHVLKDGVSGDTLQVLSKFCSK